MASGLFKVVQGVFETDKRVVSLVCAIRDAFEFVHDVQQLADKVTSIRQPITALLKQTIECCVFIREYVRRGFARRMLDASGHKMDEFEQAQAILKQRIESGVNVGAAFVSVRSAERMDEMVLKQRLNPTLSRSFDRTQCLHGTQMAIRERILDWIFSDDTRNVFWLHGVAGSGKSTIAMTIVDQLRNMSRLGAFLFFSSCSSFSLAECKGKKHLNTPSACHFVAFVKFTQTSMRPGRLNAGSRRSTWFVVANSNLNCRVSNHKSGLA